MSRKTVQAPQPQPLLTRQGTKQDITKLKQPLPPHSNINTPTQPHRKTQVLPFQCTPQPRQRGNPTQEHPTRHQASTGRHQRARTTIRHQQRRHRNKRTKQHVSQALFRVTRVNLQENSPSQSPTSLSQLQRNRATPRQPRLLPLHQATTLPTTQRRKVQHTMPLKPLPSHLRIPLLAKQRYVRSGGHEGHFIQFLQFFVPSGTQEGLNHSIRCHHTTGARTLQVVHHPPFRPAHQPAGRPTGQPANRPTGQPRFQSETIRNNQGQSTQHHSHPTTWGSAIVPDIKVDIPLSYLVCFVQWHYSTTNTSKFSAAPISVDASN